MAPPPCRSCRRSASFHRIRPLSIHEVEALWPLVVIRGAVLVASGHQQVGTDESNDYAREGLVREQLIFDRASSVPSEVMTEIIAQQLGLRARGTARASTPSRLFDTDRIVGQLDLGVSSPLLDEGAWMTDAERPTSRRRSRRQSARRRE